VVLLGVKEIKEQQVLLGIKEFKEFKEFKE
jgi:hypothetical protein